MAFNVKVERAGIAGTWYSIWYGGYLRVHMFRNIASGRMGCCGGGNSMMLANIDFRWVPTEALAKSMEDRLRILRLCQRLTTKLQLPILSLYSHYSLLSYFEFSIHQYRQRQRSPDKSFLSSPFIASILIL